MAANTLTGVIPTLFAQGLMSLRSNLVMPGMVLNSFGTEVRKKGESILIPMPSNMATTNVQPAAYAPDPQGVAPADAVIPLNNWQEAAFTLTEAEVAQIIDGIVPMQLSAAMQALAFSVNQSIFNNYVYVPNVVSDAVDPATGLPVTPFSASPAIAMQAGALMTTALSPMGDRKIVLSPGAFAEAVVLPQFVQYLYAGDKDAIDQGIITRKLGFDWAQDQQVPFATVGTVTGQMTLAADIPSQILASPTTAGAAAGAVPGQPVSIMLKTAASTGAATLKVGDVLQFGTNVITSADSVFSGAYTAGLHTATVVAAPGVQGAAATFPVSVILNANAAKDGVSSNSGATNVNLVPAHMANLAFHRSAFAFASRPLEGDRLGISDPDLTHQVSDPVSGISLRLILRPEYHRTRAAFDILWGTGPVRPELACRIMGGFNG